MEPSNNRGRGRGNPRGRGRGRGANFSSFPELSAPSIIGTLVPYSRAQNNQKDKDNNPSSSGTSSYKDATTNKVVNETTQEEKEYFENPIREIVLHIEEEDLQMHNNNAWTIKSRYLESRGYTGQSGKGRMNMEVLLTITDSVTITHHSDPSGTFITYSKCHINKIMTPNEWSLNPNGDKSIDLPEGRKALVNYWDYIDAFSKAFYYQNPRFKHSWFFTINPNVTKNQIPNWFLIWWSKFGPSIEILPQKIKDQYEIWCDTSPLVQKFSPDKLIYGQCPFLFFSYFQVPWIWRWTISVDKDKLNIPCLYRNFFYKWWKNMSEEDIGKMETQIKIQIREDKAKESKDQFSACALRDYFKNKYPKASEEEIMVKLLDHMKQQFFNTYPTGPQNDEEMLSQASSKGSQDLSNPYNCLAGESQEDDPLSPTPEDVWDMMIATIAQSSNKGKAKQTK